MARDRRPRPFDEPTVPPSPELERILCDLRSPDDQTRANAVRELCPCRGVAWGVPVFPEVIALRDDPSPIVSGAVRHDLSENAGWNERSEARRLEGRRRRQEWDAARAEIAAGDTDEAPPAPHSLMWRMPRRPRSRKWHYPRSKG